MIRKLTKTYNQFIQELYDLNPNICVLSEYQGANEKITCECMTCGRVWDTTPHTLLNAAKRNGHGNGCKKCANMRHGDRCRFNQNDVVFELKTLRPDIEIIGKYTGSNKPLACKCLNCNYEWNSTRDNLLRGRGCPNCNGHSGTSFVEQMIILAFATVIDKSEIKCRDKGLIGKELDVYIPALQLALEPGSWFWHKDKILNDAEKRMLCNDKGVKLITIFDSCDLEKPPFETDCYIFRENLSDEHNSDYLKLLIMDIMDSVDLDYSIFLETFDELEYQAKNNSKRRGTKRFKDELYEINPDIEILGEYIRGHDLIACKCRVCGYNWDAQPANLLSGKGCPKCSGTYKKTHSEFVDQIKLLNFNIEVCGEYQRDNIPIKCRCKVCNYSWEPWPTSLIQGSGCPQCARNAARERYAFSQDEVKNKLASANPNIELIGQYVNARTPVKCKCKVCGHEWEPCLDAVLNRGAGCPECARVRTNKAKFKKVRCVDTGIVYNSIKEASEALDIRTGIGACCKGKQKTAGGYHWKYVDEENSEHGTE